MDDGPDDGDQDGSPPPAPVAERSQLNSVPFLAAVGIMVVLVTFAFVFLRDDEPGRLVAPDVINQTDDQTLRLLVDDAGCVVPVRVQVSYGVDRLFVEVVVIDDPRCDDPLFDPTSDTASSFEAMVALPEPIGDRNPVPGTGRIPLPCVGSSPGYRCAPER